MPAFLNVTDIAGLVKGASTGEGLGNAFLSHIKACDAMFHLCRKYKLPNIWLTFLRQLVKGSQGDKVPKTDQGNQYTVKSWAVDWAIIQGDSN